MTAHTNPATTALVVYVFLVTLLAITLAGFIVWVLRALEVIA